MKRIAPVLVLAAAIALLSAPGAHATTIIYSATLSGLNEATPNNSPAFGYATVTFDDLLATMRVEVTFQDLMVVNTASHIHCCTAVPFTGTAGVATTTPTFTGFPTGTTTGTYDHTFDMALLSSYNATFVTNNGGTAPGAFAVLLAGAASGEAYLNIHTSLFPGGEIRGFLQPVPEPATFALLGTGIAGSLVRRWRKRR